MFGLKSCFVILVFASVSYGQGININKNCVPPTTIASTTVPTTTPNAATGSKSTQTTTTASTTQTTPTTTTTAPPPTTTIPTTTAKGSGRKRRQAPSGACIEHASCTKVNKQFTCQCDNNYQAHNDTTCVPTNSAPRGMIKASATVLATSFLLAAMFKFI